MEPRTADFRTIAREILRLARLLPVPLTLYVLCAATAYSFVDWTFGDVFTWFETLVLLADGYLVYVLIFLLMAEAGLFADGKRGGFLAFLLVSLVSDMLIVLGTLALIIPGLILFARWSPAVCDVLVRNEGVTDALGRSWDATSASMLALLPHAVIAMCGYAAVSLLELLPDRVLGIAPLGFVFIANVVGAMSVAWGVLLSVATYRLLMTPLPDHASGDGAGYAPANGAGQSPA